MLRYYCWDFLVSREIRYFLSVIFCDSLLPMRRLYIVVQVLCLIMISGDLLLALSCIVFSNVITALCHFKETLFRCS